MLQEKEVYLGNLVRDGLRLSTNTELDVKFQGESLC